MSEHVPKPTLGSGFVAACIVAGAILLCGLVLLIAGPPDAGRPAAATAPGAPGTTSGPADPGTSSDSGTGSGLGTGSVAGSDVGADRVAAGTGESRCGIPAGDQAVPAGPPTADGWEVNHRVVVPRSARYGPAKVDPDGCRRCFAHSPTGAVFAGYHAVAALSDERRAIATTIKLMVPGPDTDALIGQLRRETAGGGAPLQLAGYRIVDRAPDRVTLMLATPVENAYMSLTLTLVWYRGDWLLRPPPPGQPVGAPYAQHRDLDDFTDWSGV